MILLQGQINIVWDWQTLKCANVIKEWKIRTTFSLGVYTVLQGYQETVCRGYTENMERGGM